MNDSANSGVPTLGRIFRWAARILSIPILAFFGFFIVAHLFGSKEAATRALNVRDYVSLVAMGGWLLGLVVAWKWELIGSLIAIVGYVVAVGANRHVLLFPFSLVPVTAILFLMSSWMHRSTGRSATGEQ